MPLWRRSLALLLLLVMIFTVACSRSKPTTTEAPSTASLEAIWQAAAAALDGNLNTNQRQRSRDEAMSNLLAFLRLPESLDVPRAQWERPAREGHGALVRTYVTGPVRVYAMALPLSGVVPPGERLAVQVAQRSGGLHAFEVSVPVGGSLAGARAMEEGLNLHLSLVFQMPRGGMAVAHFQQDSRTGELRPAGNAFRGLPSRLEEYTLEQKDGLLHVASPMELAARPFYDERHPLLLYLDADVALEWKADRYQLLDERNYDAFKGFALALDSKASKADRQEAWEKATRRLPAYLNDAASWAENLAGKLPPQAAFRSHQAGSMEVRAVSVPAPSDLADASFTVIQYRAGNGLPTAQAITLPGVLEDIRVTYRHGVPGLVILSHASGGAIVSKAVTLMRMNSSNEFEPAPDWFGFLPAEAGMELTRAAESHHLILNLAGAGASASLEGGSEPAVRICPESSRCLSLTWTGGMLGGAGWVVEKIRAAQQDPAKAGEAVQAVKLFLETPEAAVLSSAELANALGASQGTGVQIFTAGPEGRAIILPQPASEAAPVLFQSGRAFTAYQPAAAHVNRWQAIWEVEGQGERWLLFLGRNDQADASLQIYRASGGVWQPVNIVNESINRHLGGQITIRYQPGQTEPNNELHVQGNGSLVVTVSADRKSVSMCEPFLFCGVYRFDGTRWLFN